MSDGRTEPASEVSSPVGRFYGGISSTQQAQTTKRWRERARVSYRDAHSEFLSAATRVGAAFDACAYVLLGQLARRELAFAGPVEVVEHLVEYMLEPLEHRFAGVGSVVGRHLGRYEAPPDFCARDVALMLGARRT